MDDAPRPGFSPLIRRHRLARMVRELRGQVMTADQLARGAGCSRSEISRLENAEGVPRIRHVISVAKALGVGTDCPQGATIIDVAHAANMRGWWDATEFKGISKGQRRCADVESAAVTMRHYNTSVMPWLLQTARYIEARDESRRADGVAVAPVHGLARLRRQQEVMGTDGPQMTILLEEQVIRRPLVDAEIMAEQLRHLAQVNSTNPRVTVQILPVRASFGRHAVPIAAFSLYTYPDPADLTAMMQPTMTDDVLVYDQTLVPLYERLFARLHEAALSPEESTALLAREADHWATAPAS